MLFNYQLTTVKNGVEPAGGFHHNSSDRLDTPEQQISGLTSNNVLSTGNKRAKRLWACVVAEKQHFEHL